MQSVLQNRRIRQDVYNDLERWRAVTKEKCSEDSRDSRSTSPDDNDKSSDSFLVEWDGEDDPLSPRNWSHAWRAWVFFVVWVSVFAVDWASSAG